MPPREWTRRTGFSPAELVAAADGSDFGEDVLAAWTAAAHRCADAEWIMSVLERPPKKGEAIVHEVHMWSALPVDQHERVLRHMLDRVDRETQWFFVASATHAWSEEFSRAVVGSLSDSAPKKGVEWWQVGEGIDCATSHSHLSVAAALEEIIGRLFGGSLPPSVEKAIGRLRLRAEMHKEFES